MITTEEGGSWWALVDFLSVRHQHSIENPETEGACLSIMRFVHLRFSEAEWCKFYRLIIKIKGQ